ISYDTQKRLCTDAFVANSTTTSKATHTSRKSGLNILSLAGVFDEYQSIAGRWLTSRKPGHYNSSLPIEALKTLVDFD
ncbi:hypothetical protein K501DRAFT_158314, partial [Backusella circina FSU 941]